MKPIISTIGLALVAFAITSVTQAQMVEPTENHKLLHKEAGTWDAKIKVFMAGAEGQESQGTEINEVVCNGMWVRSHFKAKMMGMDFEGIGMFTYNPDKKKFVGFWGDNMSSNSSSMEGEYDEDEKTFTYKVKSIDPMSGEEVTNKHVVKWIDDETRVFTIFMPDGSKMMEINYKKKK